MGGCGLLTLRLKKTSLDAYTELFCGLDNVIMGGIVPGIGVASLNKSQGFAFATLIESTPATTVNANMRTSADAVLSIIITIFCVS